MDSVRCLLDVQADLVQNKTINKKQAKTVFANVRLVVVVGGGGAGVRVVLVVVVSGGAGGRGGYGVDCL